MNAMSVPPPLKLRSTIIHKPDGTQITIPISKISVLMVLMLGTLGYMCALGIVGIVSPRATTGQFSRSSSDLIAILTMSYMFALGIGCLLYAFGGRTVLLLKTDCIVVKRGVFGFGWTSRLDVSDLFNLRSYMELTNEGNSYTVPGVLVDYRGNICRFGGSRFGGRFSREEAEYLVSQISMHYPSVNVLSNAPVKATKTITSWFGFKIDVIDVESK